MLEISNEPKISFVEKQTGSSAECRYVCWGPFEKLMDLGLLDEDSVYVVDHGSFLCSNIRPIAAYLR